MLTYIQNFMVFVITGICLESLQHALPSDLIHVINVKIVRRNSKKGFRIMDFVNDEVFIAVNEASSYLDKHLRTCESRLSASQVPELSPATLQDIDLKLVSSRARISQALSREHTHGSIMSYSVSTLERLEFFSDGLPSLTSDSCSPLVLLDFEDWVEYHLQDVVRSTSTCLRLKQLFDCYYTSATSLYSDLSEQNSIMALTLLEMWLVMDQILCQLITLLQDFTPEIPVSLATVLLLPKLSQLRRLAQIESYLANRHNCVAAANPSHFAKPSWNSFAAQYYNKFEEFPHLRLIIEKAAENERASRKQVWTDTSTKYYSLIQQATRIGFCSIQSDRWVSNTLPSSTPLRHKLAGQRTITDVEFHVAGLSKVSYKAKLTPASPRATNTIHHLARNVPSRQPPNPYL